MEMTPEETAKSLNNTAMTLDKNGHVYEAGKYYLRALQVCLEAFGAAHPDTAAMQNNLALLYYRTGRVDEAVSLMQAAVDYSDTALGPGHANSIAARKTLVVMQTKANAG